MYYSIQLQKLGSVKDGDHLLYRRFSFREDFKPEVIVVDIQNRYNARSIETPTEKELSKFVMIQCIDRSEIEVCSEKTHPEYYL